MSFPIVLVAFIFALGCASPTQQVQPFASTPLIPHANEEIVVENLLILVDASGSIRKGDLFQQEKTLVEQFFRNAPRGHYKSGQIVFGGEKRQTTAFSFFNRTRMVDAASRIEFLDRSSELHQVLDEARVMLEDRSGHAAIVIFSDGKPNAHRGSHPGEELALRSAVELAAARRGATCFFTVQTSDDPEGAVFLQDLSHVTRCGDYRTAASIQSITPLHAFERSVFLSEQLPDVAAGGIDRDADGVANDLDRCPQSPRGERVTSEGCWRSTLLFFRHDSSQITDAGAQRLYRVARTLKRIPNSRIRIDGFADSSGPTIYNQALSDRRAQAALQYMESQGIDPKRFRVRALGESNPRLPNDTPPNRSANRRIEFSQQPK
jgi:outer membrane protein OmpA-like peptidoglycan-associated protein